MSSNPTITVEVYPAARSSQIASARVRLQTDLGPITIDDCRLLRNKSGVVWFALPSYSLPTSGRQFEYRPDARSCTRPIATDQHRSTAGMARKKTKRTKRNLKEPRMSSQTLPVNSPEVTVLAPEIDSFSLAPIPHEDDQSLPNQVAAFPCTDAGNAELFAAICGNCVRS